jgi:hypothetical protein
MLRKGLKRTEPSDQWDAVPRYFRPDRRSEQLGSPSESRKPSGTAAKSQRIRPDQSRLNIGSAVRYSRAHSRARCSARKRRRLTASEQPSDGDLDMPV